MRSPVISPLVALVTLLALASFGCGSSLPGDLRHAAQSDRVPSNLVVTYDDHDAERGGIRLVLRADRTLSASRWSPGQSEDAPTEWSGRVPPETLAALVDLLVQIEAWEQRTPDEEGRLDDAKARLTVRVGRERASIWEWVTDMEATGRLVRIKQHLEALAFGLRHPLVDGAEGAIAGDRAP